MFYTNKIIGWLSHFDCNAISLLAKQVPEDGIIVEVGSLMGKSAISLAENVSNTVSIYCIDEFPKLMMPNQFKEFNPPLPEYKKIYNIHEEFISNTSQFKNIHMIKGSSPYCFDEDHFMNTLDIDLFFLDASHRNPNDWDNIEYFLPKIKNGGLIAGHDYSPSFPDVYANVKKLETLLSQRVTNYINSSIWSFKLS